MALSGTQSFIKHPLNPEENQLRASSSWDFTRSGSEIPNSPSNPGKKGNPSQNSRFRNPSSESRLREHPRVFRDAFPEGRAGKGLSKLGFHVPALPQSPGITGKSHGNGAKSGNGRDWSSWDGVKALPAPLLEIRDVSKPPGWAGKCRRFPFFWRLQSSDFPRGEGGKSGGIGGLSTSLECQRLDNAEFSLKSHFFSIVDFLGEPGPSKFPLKSQVFYY